jgi:hypothetical protein
LTKEKISKFQPSTKTKRRSLRGRLSIIGGSMSIPIEIKTVDTTKSITKKGMYRRKPL